jgi:hypothetical protein
MPQTPALETHFRQLQADLMSPPNVGLDNTERQVRPVPTLFASCPRAPTCAPSPGAPLLMSAVSRSLLNHAFLLPVCYPRR